MSFDIIGPIALLVVAAFVFNWLRGKFPVINTYWSNGIIWLVAAVILIHVGIRWEWPNFCGELWYQSGFLIFQILLAVGLYLRFGLKDKKFLKWPGVILIGLGLIGIGWNVWVAYSINHYSTEYMTSTDSEHKNFPPQNKEVEKEVTKFWKKHVSEQSALSMLRIVRRQSGFNQFDRYGKPYRSQPDSKKVGVMQIDDSLWSERATELGYNLNELDGNMRFALWLFNEKSFEPWGGEPIRKVHIPWFSDKAEEKIPAAVENKTTKPSPLSAKLSAANPDGEIRVREFWDKNPPKGPVIEIVNVAWMESDFQQFDPADRTKPFIHVNEDGSRDIGAYQINDVQWKKELALPSSPSEIKSYNLTTWEGNLAAAHYLENKYGAKNWSTYDDVRLRLSGESYTRTAPVDGWSKRVYAHPDIVVNIYVDGDVVVRNDKGQFFKGGPKIFQNYGLSKWVQYQSATGQPVTLSIKPFK